MSLPYTTDSGIGARASMGLLLLQEDATIEAEFGRMVAADDIAVYHSRIAMQPDVSATSLAAMRELLPGSAAMLPTSVAYDAIGYACTSAAAIIGSDAIEQAVQTVIPGVKVTDPIRALIAACKALQVRRIAYVSPYIPEVSLHMRKLLEKNGLIISTFDSFDESDDRVVARISPSSILQAVQQVAASSDCAAVIVSCTNLRILDILQQAEQRIGKPVLSSNLALAWHMLRLAGVSSKVICGRVSCRLFALGNGQ